ncbi:Hcp family type VI secretion system effector [Pseudoduganella namucuonensis]|uniref:Type VI secretion system secreted protein Hcp n=1 Tax=Pseudoduganella namucuonensis TaxID=1035707 RepID=A0A1I7KPT1_9BURK|nr:type VI secretion system tube protein Hcp [Pseudoduganella namucuonensis]SFU99374.1 type VI secretion system secreted protein Hcp [Pseudoduganella namucuonensis]
MAVDMFLKLDDVKGESRDGKHKDEVDVLAWSFGAANAGTTHTGGGGGAGKVSVQDLSITKWVDKASPNLIMATCSGKHFKEALLTVRKAGDNPLEYLKVTMKEVLVSKVATGGSGGEERLTENITLNFSWFKVEYTPQKADGSGDAAVEAAWDIAANQKG